MFVGPNGSGKSTLKSMIRPELLGIYVNPDDIEKEIREYDFLDFNNYQISTTKREVLDFFASSSLLKKTDLLDDADMLRFNDNKLIFFATEDPAINVSRVCHRVKMGGHSVPEDKIISRYKRSLDLLMQAIQYTNRAYIFDNSTHEHIWLAEITDGQTLEIKTDQLPAWFKNVLA